MGTVATLLDEHVSFRCASVDRIGIRGYIGGLQYEGGVVKFLLNRGGFIPSPALLNRNHERLVGGLEALVENTRVPVVALSPESPKRTSLGPTKTRRRRRVDPDWCWSARPRSGPRRGGATSTTPTSSIAPAIPTSPGVAGPRCPTTGTSISPIPSGARPSSRSAPTRPTRCGAGCYGERSIRHITRPLQLCGQRRISRIDSHHTGNLVR